MDVYLDGNVIAEIPDSMCRGDTIILRSGVYEIMSKTIDLTDEHCSMYCKVQLYEDILFASDVLYELYNGSFTTSGPNTNKISDNPRVIVLFIILSVILDEDHVHHNLKNYQKNIVDNWYSKTISWDIVLPDNPQATKAASKAAPIIAEMLKNAKITDGLWPAGLQNLL